MKTRDVKRNILPYFFMFGLLAVLFGFYIINNRKENKLTYNELMQNVNNGLVEKMEITPSKDGGVYTIEGMLKSYKENESFKVTVPLSDNVFEIMKPAIHEFSFPFSTSFVDTR